MLEFEVTFSVCPEVCPSWRQGTEHDFAGCPAGHAPGRESLSCVVRPGSVAAATLGLGANSIAPLGKLLNSVLTQELGVSCPQCGGEGRVGGAQAGQQALLPFPSHALPRHAFLQAFTSEVLRHISSVRTLFYNLTGQLRNGAAYAAAELTASASLKWKCRGREAVPRTLAVVAFEGSPLAHGGPSRAVRPGCPPPRWPPFTQVPHHQPLADQF